jgi:hypothetical protein
MKSVNITVLKLKVSKFFPKDAKVELSIMYSNDTVKEITKTDRITYSQSLARRIMAEIRKTVKAGHQRFEDGAMVARDLTIYIHNEDEAINKISYFLEQLRLSVERVRNMKVAEGYMDAVRDVQKMELKLA